MKEFRKDVVKFDEFIKNNGLKIPPWITYNPDLTKQNGAQYELRSGQCNDGTYVHTYGMLADLINRLLKQESYYTGFDPIDWKEVKDIQYEVGDIYSATMYDKVKVGDENSTMMINGQVERIWIPVKCKLVFK